MNQPPLRLGLYAEMQTPPGKPHAAVYSELLAQMEHADRVGFDVYSVIEHHFFEQFSISAHPLALFAAAAQRTQRLRFRVALHTLPLTNPMRLAGEIAAADLLTGGRLEAGLGRGHAWLFERSGVDLAESRGRYDEAVDILLRAWTEDTFSHTGRYYRFRDLSVVPKPLQRPHPPLYTGGTSVATYEQAGRRGWGVFLPPLLPLQAMQPSIDAYLGACDRAGHAPNLVYLRPCYLGDDPRQVERDVAPYLRNFLAFNASPVRGLPPRDELIAKGYGFYASGALESLTQLTYQQIVEQEIAFVGTPEQVAEQVRRLRRQVPIAELALVTNFGGLPHEQVVQTQERFAREVRPAL